LSGEPCPRLAGDSRCEIHDDPGRPGTCKRYPLSFDHEKIVAGVDQRCLAYSAGLLDGHLASLQKLGYPVVLS